MPDMNRRDVLKSMIGVCLGAPVVQALAAAPVYAIGADISGTSVVTAHFVNWSGSYVLVDKATLIKSMRRAIALTEFKEPVQ
jgi:hypothetical protein